MPVQGHGRKSYLSHTLFSCQTWIKVTVFGTFNLGSHTGLAKTALAGTTQLKTPNHFKSFEFFNAERNGAAAHIRVAQRPVAGNHGLIRAPGHGHAAAAAPTNLAGPLRAIFRLFSSSASEIRGFAVQTRRRESSWRAAKAQSGHNGDPPARGSQANCSDVCVLLLPITCGAAQRRRGANVRLRVRGFK